MNEIEPWPAIPDVVLRQKRVIDLYLIAVIALAALGVLTVLGGVVLAWVDKTLPAKRELEKLIKRHFESEQEAKMAEMTNALAEQPAEYEIAAAVVGDVLPQLRQALLALAVLEMTWYANGIDVTIEKLAADENATLAGLPISAWMAWSAVFQSLNQWLNTPIDETGTTPAKLMRRYK